MFLVARRRAASGSEGFVLVLGGTGYWAFTVFKHQYRMSTLEVLKQVHSWNGYVHARGIYVPVLDQLYASLERYHNAPKHLSLVYTSTLKIESSSVKLFVP